MVDDNLKDLLTGSKLLSDSLSKIQTSIKSYKEEISRLKAENKKLNDMLSAFQQQYYDETTGLKYQINKLKEENQLLKEENEKFKSNIKKISTENLRLKAENEEDKKNIKKLTERLKQATETAKRQSYELFKDEIFKLKSDIKLKEEKIKELSEIISREKNKNNEINKRKNDLLVENHKLKEKLKATEAKLQEEISKEENNEKVKELLKIIQDLKGKLNELIDKNKEYLREREIMKSKLIELNDRIKWLKDNNSSVLEENEKLNKELNKIKAERDKLKMKATELEADFNHRQTIELELRKQMRLINEELVANNQLIEKLKRELKNKDELNKLLKETNDKLMKKTEGLNEEVNKLTDKLSQRDALILQNSKEMKKVEEKYRQQIDKIKENIMKEQMSRELILNTKIRELKRHVEQLKKLLREKDKRIKKLLAMINAHAENIARGKAPIEEMDEEKTQVKTKENEEALLLKKPKPVENVPEFLKVPPKTNKIPEELNKADVEELLSMIKIGVANNNSLEDIRESLINSRYDVKKIDEAFRRYKEEVGE